MNKPKKSVIEVQGMDISVISKFLVSSFPRAAWECSCGAPRHESMVAAVVPLLIPHTWRGAPVAHSHAARGNEEKPLEFERFKNKAGSNYFVLSPQRWNEANDALYELLKNVSAKQEVLT